MLYPTRRRAHAAFLPLVVVLMLLRVPSAAAQQGPAVEGLSPAPDVAGSVFGVYGSQTLSPWQPAVYVFGSYARAPLGLQDGESGEDIGDLVGSIGTLSVLGGLGLTDWLDVGLAVPVHRVSAGSDFGESPPPAASAATVGRTRVAMGDMRLVPRARLFGPAPGESGFGLAALMQVYLPTGDDSVYAGEAFRAEPRLAVDYVNDGLRVAVNAGYLLRSRVQVLDTKVDDFVTWGLGAEAPLVQGWSLIGELSGQINVLANDFDNSAAPTELLAGVRWRLRGWLAQLGGGAGLFDALAAPQWRALLAVGYAPEPVRDTDGDGLDDPADGCPDRPEDRDGYEDQDGCPDGDDDGDGVADAVDACPREAEDADGHEDEDGCPDPDNDGDGVPDAHDGCPGEAEDADAFQDDDGCPDPDNDGDGVPDAEDDCVNEAGDPAHAGCPAPPPPAQEPAVKVTDTRIEIGERIYFAPGLAEIEDRSLKVLGKVAQLLDEHPELQRIRIAGHTDDTGRAAVNRRLSQRRAQAVVDYLVGQGVSETRLVAKGFGPDEPVASNATEEGRAENRRVELEIVERKPPAQVTPSDTAPQGT